MHLFFTFLQRFRYSRVAKRWYGAALNPCLAQAGGKGGTLQTWKTTVGVAAGLWLITGGLGRAEDLGDILLKKGVITPEELRQAKEEEKQKAAAEESRRDSILAKLPKWLEMVTLFGDLRLRYEGLYEHNLNANNRERLRGRLGMAVNPAEEVGMTFRLATGDPNDPISTNQSFTNTFTRKPFNLDWAYLTVKPGKTFHIEPGWFTLVGGKFGVNQLYRITEMMWDDDLAPEGALEIFNLFDHREGFFRSVKVTGLQWVVDQVSTASDPWVIGGQGVVDMAVDGTANWTVALADYGYQNLNEVATKFISSTGSSPNSSLANSNFLAFTNGKISGFESRFNMISFTTEFNFVDPVGLGIPAGIFGDMVYNTQARNSQNTGVWVGAGVGNAGRDWYHDVLKNVGDWGVSYTYVWVQKDATLSLFSYSNFDYQRGYNTGTTQKGSTNVMGSILRLDYMLFPNFQLTVKSHFINPVDRELATTTQGVPLTRSGNETLTRLQVDALLKF